MTCPPISENAALSSISVYSHLYHLASPVSKCHKAEQTTKLIIFNYQFHTLNTQKDVRFYPPLPISVTISIFTILAFIFLTLNPNIPILFNAIPQHITNSLIEVDIKHFVKPCSFTSGDMHSRAIMIHIESYLVVYKLT